MRRILETLVLAVLAVGCERGRAGTSPDKPEPATPPAAPASHEGSAPPMAADPPPPTRPRIPADQQIGLIEDCEEARRQAVRASAAERDQALSRWILAIQNGRGLCTNGVHEALVMKDDDTHAVALQLLKRIDWREHKTSFLSDLGSERLSAEQRARVFACLRAISGKDFGTDRAAWEAWLRQA